MNPYVIVIALLIAVAVIALWLGSAGVAGLCVIGVVVVAVVWAVYAGGRRRP
jgi:hypothetical protein